jgi:hypothetical protein
MDRLYVYDAYVKRMSDGEIKTKEFASASAAFDFLWPSLEKVWIGPPGSAGVEDGAAWLALAAGEAIITGDGYEYRIEKREPQ